MKTSPLAPDSFPQLNGISGVRLATVASGVKYQQRDDLLLVACDADTTVAGVLTLSGTASAPVQWCRENLPTGQARALLVNAGNANAFTGETGVKDVVTSCEAVAISLGCRANEVLVASTGVIGETLPIEKITCQTDELVANLQADHWHSAAQAILTTDTFAKGSSIKTTIGDTKISINGFAKGSGMIEPNMATMLAFVFTDANIPSTILQQILAEANRDSFNSITVDSDTSTSDTCLLFATGKANNTLPVSADDDVLNAFKNALLKLMQDLAVQVVRDGEGASKLIKVEVTSAENDQEAKVVAKAIANSPLVKTAIAGEDANWGRIVMAIGKSAQTMEQRKLAIGIGGITIAKNGERVADYDETPVAKHLQQNEVLLQVDMGLKQGVATVWTCDLTHGYIEINADYRS